ncbi:diaminopimelate epimerase [Lachnospiraceae bacterium ZAX-1]
MHGIGNDYVYVDCFKETVDKPEEIAKFVSDRHIGVGSDGLILIKPSNTADFAMEIYNGDGSRAEMCGNGIRCVAKYVYDYGLTDKTKISIETLAGIKYLELTVLDGQAKRIKVNMGEPILTAEDIPVLTQGERAVDVGIEVKGKQYQMTCVSMGNPHCVLFLDEDVKELELEAIGPYFENHAFFPKRINTEFANIIDQNTIRMRVWERGSAETLACGTGACATAVAAILNRLTKNEVTVQLLGGDLDIKWDKETNLVYMSGSATTVFDGEVVLPKQCI